MNTFIKNLSTKRWLGILIIVLVGVVAYHNCLPNEMFWDDDDFINNNRFIRDFHYWPLWFSQNLVAGSYLVSNYWRPLLLAIFSLEWHLWHNWVYGWHAVAVGMHLLAAIMLFYFIDRLFKNRLLSFLTALIFVAHPVHNEAVVYVNSMGDSLATLLVLASLTLFTQFRQSQESALTSRPYYFSLLMLPLGLLSKETAIVAIGLLALTDFLLLSNAKSFGGRVVQVIAALWPFIAMGVIYLILRATCLNFSNSFNFYNQKNEFTTHISIRLMTFLKAMTQYAGFLFFPHQLRVERAMEWGRSLLEWDVLMGAIIVGLMLFAAFKFWKSKPWVSFGIGWFFIAIAPTSNVLVPINATIYEHFLYMPMIGITLIVVTLAVNWAQDHQALGTLFKILAVIILVFCGVNIHRNLDWRTSIGFYEQLISYRPDDYRVINNLGMEYANKGIYDKALNTYLKAIAVDPNNPVAYHNIAGTYRDTGHIDLAIENFNRVIALNPNFIFTYRSLADLYWRLGKYEKCKENLLQILRIDPNDMATREALAQVQQKLQTK